MRPHRSYPLVLIILGLAAVTPLILGRSPQYPVKDYLRRVDQAQLQLKVINLSAQDESRKLLANIGDAEFNAGTSLSLLQSYLERIKEQETLIGSLRVPHEALNFHDVMMEYYDNRVEAGETTLRYLTLTRQFLIPTGSSPDAKNLEQLRERIKALDDAAYWLKEEMTAERLSLEKARR